MRGRRAFVVLTVYLAVMSGIIAIAYLSYVASANTPYGPNTRDTGKVVMGIVVTVQVFLAMFMAPSFTAGAIVGEKERQTFELLRTTLLPAKAFVTGKLLSALSYVFLLIFASLPLQSIAFFLGGVSWIEIVISQLLIMVAAVTYALLGLLVSSIMKSTLAASVMTFTTIFFISMMAPGMVLLVISMMAPFMMMAPSSWAYEVAAAIGALLLASINLPATLIASAMMLIEKGGVFYAVQDFSSGGTTHSIVLPSPWILFIIVHIFFSILMYWITVRRVRRISSK